MVNIQKILNKIGPLSSQQLVERFIGMLSSAGIHKLSEKEITRIRMFATDDCEAFLEESLTAYLSHGIVNIKKRKDKSSSPSSLSYYTDNYSFSLKAHPYGK